MTQSYFITSTGTGIGKTYVTQKLIREARAEGKNVAALKPIISGWEDEPTDTACLLEALGLAYSQENIETVSPWRFTAPLSPDMAARKENRALSLDEIVAFCQQQREVDITFIEGVGGVMVPLNEQHTVLDWMKALSLPIILVTGSYLGTISHTLTALSVLSANGLTVDRLIISETPDSTVSLEDTKHTLENFCNVKIEVLPYRS
jgi:dethiobiotin synthetase